MGEISANRERIGGKINRTEEALKEIQERLDLALESGQMGVWDLDLIHDTAWRSLRHDQIFGYESLLPEWGSAIFFQHIVPEDRDRVRNCFNEAFRTGQLVFECRITWPDQSLHWIFARGQAYSDEKGRPVRMLGTVMDITERKHAEEVHSRLVAIVEFSDDAIFSKTLDGIILSWNPGAEKIYGYSADEVIGKPASILIPQGYSDEIPDILERIRRGENITHYEAKRAKKDGNQIDVSLTISPIKDGAGKIIGASTIARDITERKRADEEMRLHSMIVANMEEGVILIRAGDGEIVHANPKFEKMFGYMPDELVGKNVSLVNAPTDKTPEEIAKEIIGALNTNGAWSGEVQNIKKDGTTFPCYANVSTFRHSSYGALWVSVHQDITERKLAERALLKEKKFTEIALDSQHDTFFVFDPSTNKAIRWNKAFRDITGYTDEEIDSLKAPDSYYSLEDLEKAASSIESIMRNGKARVELSLICKGGRKIPTEYEASFIRNEYGEPKYIISIGRDITERKRAEDALRESEARACARADELAALMDAIPTITFISHDPECRSMTSSSTALRLLRLPFGANTSKSAPENERPDTFRPMKDGHELRPEELPVQLAAATGQDVRNFELTLAFNDGTVCDILGDAVPLFDAEGKVRGAIGAFLDITERKRAENALKESEERNRLLVDFSPYGIVIHSEGKLVLMNQAGAKILGAANPEELIGIPVLQIIHPDYHELVKERIRMQEDGKAAPLIEEKFLRLDGTSVDVEISSIPFTYKGKQAMYGVFMDITEHKKMEELSLENSRLVLANKAKSEFLAIMSHELRTPLNAIIGFSELLKQDRGRELTEKQERYVDNVLTGGKHLLDLVTNILDLTNLKTEKNGIVHGEDFRA